MQNSASDSGRARFSNATARGAAFAQKLINLLILAPSQEDSVRVPKLIAAT